MFYFIGSLLFVVALIAALSVILVNLLAYRAKMVAALRSLSMDRVAPTAAQSVAPARGLKAPAATTLAAA